MRDVVPFLLAMSSALPAQPFTDEEVCVVAERPRRDPKGRPPPVGAADAWRTLRADLEAGFVPRPVDPQGLLGYLPADDPAPVGEDPLAVRVDVAPHPEDVQRSVVRVGVRARGAEAIDRAPVDLVVVVDVSASMDSRLGVGYPPLGDVDVDFARARWPWFQYTPVTRHDLARATLGQLVRELGPHDQIAVVNFGKGADVFVPPSPGDPDEALLDQVARITVPRAGDPDIAIDLAQQTMAEMRRPCRDWRYLVISDGGAALGRSFEASLGIVAKTAAEGVTWSGITLGQGLTPAEGLEGVAWAGYGWHGYADNPHEARVVFQRMLRARRVIGRDPEVVLDFGGAPARRIDGAAALPAEVEAGSSAVQWFEVDAPARTLEVQASWSVGSPVPGDWTRTGTTRAVRTLAFEEASPDLRLGWAAWMLARHAADGDADWAGIFALAEGARRPHHAIDVEFLAMIARTAAVHAQARSVGH